MGKWTINESDPAVDGHPCEVALAFRHVIIRSGIAEEIQSDIIDLAIQFAWIGKAISRTQKIDNWFISGIDPNARGIITAMATDSFTRQTALTHAINGKAIKGMEKSLINIRKTKAFMNAADTVKALCTIPSPCEIERLSKLCGLAIDMGDRCRFLKQRNENTIISIEAFKKRQEMAK